MVAPASVESTRKHWLAVMAQDTKRRKGWIIGPVLAGTILLGGSAALTSCSVVAEDAPSAGSKASASKSPDAKPAVPKPVAVVTPDADAVEGVVTEPPEDDAGEGDAGGMLIGLCGAPAFRFEHFLADRNPDCIF